jgi:class 3 adenylate cyclase
VRAELPRGTVTFLFSDIEGSTALSRQHGLAFGDLRAEHRRLLRAAFEDHGGFMLEAEGDACFVVFERATDAVTAAVAAQRALAASDVVRVRIGIHTTEPHLHADGYVGVGVSRAARICAAGHGGQIVLSHATAGVVEDHGLPDIELRSLGEHYLKDIVHPQRLFQVDVDGLQSEFPPLGATPVAGSVGTLLLTDVAGWSGVMRELGDDAAAAAASAYHGIVRQHARAADGTLVERAGDNTLVVFASPAGAVEAAVAIRGALRDGGWIDARIETPEVCAAVHTGRFARPDEGHYGSAAFRVGRLCALAEPGQILVSHTTQALLEGHVFERIALRDLGQHELLGVDPPTRVYEVVELES